MAAAEVDIGRGEIAEALVVSAVIVVLDEGVDGVLESTGQIVVLEQDAVLQSLVLPLDIALGLRVDRGAADMVHSLTLEPVCQLMRDVGRAVVAEQPCLVPNLTCSRDPQPALWYQSTG